MKKIVIDARLSGLKNAGIGRYIQSLVDYLPRVQSSLPAAATPQALQAGEFRVQIQAVSPNIRHYSIKEQVFLIPELLDLKPNLVHFPHFNVPLLYNKPFVVTIHDLLWHDRVGFSATTLPKWMYLVKYIGYRAVLRHAILKSKAIIVPSKWVKAKIIARFSEVEGKISVIYEGVSKVFKGPALPRQGRALSYDFSYIIYTGSLYPHKNVAAILNVLKHFDDLKLVVACARNVFWEKFRQEVGKRGLENKVILAGFVPDEELVVLYGKAAAFVFPSLSEGFGLPGLEAMAAGCPVISSTAGALPEIYGKAAAYFEPMNEVDLVKEIREIRENKGYSGEMIKLGRERAKMFSWERCAKETLEVYQKVLRAPAVRSPLPWSTSTRRGVATAGFGRTS